MVLFIDDLREPILYSNEKVIVARNYWDAIAALTTYNFSLVSFDHDLRRI